MKSIAWTIILLIGLVGVIVNVSKKWITNQYPEITMSNVFSLSMWWNLIINPYTILTLFISLSTFVLSLWLFSIEQANNAVLGSMLVTLPILVLNIYFNYRFLGEIISSTQYLGMIISTVGIIVTGIGMWLFVGGLA
jgi:drug/metabolite transporter (DMT)-like permease